MSENADPVGAAGSGLSHADAARRLAKDGSNALPGGQRRTGLAIVAETVREPMFLLLLAAGSLYLAFGDLQEGLTLFGFVLVTLGLTLYQEGETERAIDALRDLTSPRALVIRDGQNQRIAGRDVVRDDLLRLNEGDRVPADAILLSVDGLRVDESLLTGEAVPVSKVASQGEAPPARPGGDDQPWVYAGTLVVHGQASARVTATGPRSEIGRIGVAPLFGGAALWLAVLQGLGVLAVVLAGYAWADNRLPEAAARAFAFATLVVANLALIFSSRSGTGALWTSLRTPNATPWIVVGVAARAAAAGAVRALGRRRAALFAAAGT